MIIYVDSEKHCHETDPNGTFREIDESFFDGKCKEFIEGYCYDDSDGYVKIYPWKPSSELDAAQRGYERQKLAEYEVALANSIPISDLDAAYQEGVNSI